MRRAAAVVIAATAGAGFYSSYKRRPRCSYEIGSNLGVPERALLKRDVTREDGAVKFQGEHGVITIPRERFRHRPPPPAEDDLMTTLFRRLMISVVMGGTMALFNALQDVHVHDGEKFEKAIRLSEGTGRGGSERGGSGSDDRDDAASVGNGTAGTASAVNITPNNVAGVMSAVPVVTVCNHLSIVDDPCICGAITPRFSSLFSRWGLCAEEICFKRDLYAWGFGTGNILPVLRGVGTEQENLFLLTEKVRPGMWVNIFPEGRVWQDPSGGKPHPGGIGGGRPYLKWGTAKVLLHAYPYKIDGESSWMVSDSDAQHPAPVLLPFVHRGMEEVYPQRSTKDGGKSRSIFPKVGKRVDVIVGDPVPIHDLAQRFASLQHEATVTIGPLASAEERRREWDREPTAEEKEIYSELMSRLQTAMQALDKVLDARRDAAK